MLVIMLLLTTKLQSISAIEHHEPNGGSLAINISGAAAALEAGVLTASFAAVDADYAGESTSIDVRTRCDKFL
jgi:hypothetical protein